MSSTPNTQGGRHKSDSAHSHKDSHAHEHKHEGAWATGHDHAHEHKHEGTCAAGHDHGHEHKHEGTCAAGHDHAHEHKHEGTCAAGHDHAHEHKHEAAAARENHDHDSDDHEHGCDHDHEHQHGHHHGHGHHHHGPGGHHHAHMPNNRKGMTIALLVTGLIMIVEFFGGLISGSLALLADSAHMLSDTVAIALSLFAMWFALRPASPSKTYGFHRFEIIAALFNGIALFVIAGFIVVEAYERFMSPTAIASGTMMVVAAVGLLANLISAWVLLRQSDVHGNVNVRSAYLHIVGDALGSVGVLAAGLLMYAFGWYWADPVISVLVSLLVLKSAWGVISHTVHILMEGTPAEINRDEVEGKLLAIPGVVNVHDLHIWTITSGLDSLSCHLLIRDEEDGQRILQQAITTIEKRFAIRHATIQIEKTGLLHAELKV